MMRRNRTRYSVQVPAALPRLTRTGSSMSLGRVGRSCGVSLTVIRAGVAGVTGVVTGLSIAQQRIRSGERMPGQSDNGAAKGRQRCAGRAFSAG